MPVSRTDLADYGYFLAIARHRSFRRAGLDLGVSASALSHALKGLETRVGIRLQATGPPRRSTNARTIASPRPLPAGPLEAVEAFEHEIALVLGDPRPVVLDVGEAARRARRARFEYGCQASGIQRDF